ncbi:hypothetical protein MDAP_000576 [Mitosporidium daphniae]|uniref:Uncharacterized protein n=1 Tax=Mitosporidium daphniae TaxID=1485682 RepID=A0A098VN07_9MICR|nr:uncharacterized protein DI09_70p80 [Mitosporidium daphniae]KGG50413.1 hypothetical protein DI09_70p80 [Mitosporidium daphniae]|eukprot:XP_013236851.1 uncharacterized protein DI09_70p80 [Mitosporidium daphniae]
MNTIKTLSTLALILLVRSVLSKILNIEYLCNFIGDKFIPEVFKGEEPVAVNKAMKTIFSLSKNNLLNQEYAISPEVYDKIMDTILQVSNFNPSDVYKKVQDLKILPYDTELRAFGDQTKSVVFFCGYTGHAMLCEIFKVASPDPKHEHLWKVLIYNTGGGLKHHPWYHVGPTIKFSPVVVYEGPPFLINENWIEAALNFGEYKKVITNFYPRLFGDFDRSNEIYDVFIDPQRGGTCAFSSYHAYFIFKLKRKNYNEIFAIASLIALQHFVSQKDPDFVSEEYRTKYAFSSKSKLRQSSESQEDAENFIYKALLSDKNVLNEIERFHFLRWNFDLVDTMFKYLVEIGNCIS